MGFFLFVINATLFSPLRVMTRAPPPVSRNLFIEYFTVNLPHCLDLMVFLPPVCSLFNLKLALKFRLIFGLDWQVWLIRLRIRDKLRNFWWIQRDYISSCNSYTESASVNQVGPHNYNEYLGIISWRIVSIFIHLFIASNIIQITTRISLSWHRFDCL